VSPPQVVLASRHPQPAPPVNPANRRVGQARRMTAIRPVPVVPEVARWQAGVFTRQQAIAEGWTDRQVRRRMATGAWLRIAGRGLAGSGIPPDAEALAWAAALTWPDAVVSHLTAGRLHGFPLPGYPPVDQPVAYVIGRTGIRRAVRIRAQEDRLTPEDVDVLDGLVLTSASRTAIDCLAMPGCPPGRSSAVRGWRRPLGSGSASPGSAGCSGYWRQPGTVR
jgi:Transcriptional regulator, AbiEi antitoxin